MKHPSQPPVCKCANCGEPVWYDSTSAVFIHAWGRWPLDMHYNGRDNGYYCYNKEDDKRHATKV